MSAIALRWRINKLNYYVPIQEFHSTVTFYSPRRPTVIEWGIMALVDRFGEDSDFSRWPMDQIFSQFLSVPDTDRLVLPILENLVYQHRILSCARSLAEWNSIQLGEITFTQEGRSIYKRGVLPSADQEKAVKHLYDVIAGKLLESTERKKLISQNDDSKILVPSTEDWEENYPLALIRDEIEQKSATYSWFKDQTEIRNVTKNDQTLLWNTISATFEIDDEGLVEIQLSKPEYEPLLSQWVAMDPETYLPFNQAFEENQLSRKEWSELSERLKKIEQYEEKTSVKTVREHVKLSGAKHDIHFVGEELFHQGSGWEKVKGCIVVLTSSDQDLNIAKEKECTVISFPVKEAVPQLLYLNGQREHLMAAALPIELAINGMSTEAAFSYTVKDPLVEWNTLTEKLTSFLMLEADRYFDQGKIEQGIDMFIILSYWMSRDEIWKQLNKSLQSHWIPVKEQLFYLRKAKEQLSSGTGKMSGSWQEDILGYIKEALSREEKPLQALDEWLQTCPVPLLKDSSSAVMELLEDMNDSLQVDNGDELEEILQGLAKLPLHQSTVNSWVYPALFNRQLVKERISYWLEGEEKQENSLTFSTRLDQGLKSLMEVQSWFTAYFEIGKKDPVGTEQFKLLFSSVKIRGIMTKIEEWDKTYLGLKETVSEVHQQLAAYVEESSFGKMNEVVQEFHQWLEPFCMKLPEGTGRVYILDDTTFLERPDILRNIPEKETIFIPTTVIQFLYDQLYVLIDGDEKENEQVLRAIKAVEQAREANHENVRFVESDISLLLQPEQELAHSIAVAMNYLLYNPMIVTSDAEAVTMKQGVNSLPILGLEKFLNELNTARQQQKGRKDKKRKNNHKKKK